MSEINSESKMCLKSHELKKIIFVLHKIQASLCKGKNNILLSHNVATVNNRKCKNANSHCIPRCI